MLPLRRAILTTGCFALATMLAACGSQLDPQTVAGAGHGGTTDRRAGAPGPGAGHGLRVELGATGGEHRREREAARGEDRAS